MKENCKKKSLSDYPNSPTIIFISLCFILIRDCECSCFLMPWAPCKSSHLTILIFTAHHKPAPAWPRPFLHVIVRSYVIFPQQQAHRWRFPVCSSRVCPSTAPSWPSFRWHRPRPASPALVPACGLLIQGHFEESENRCQVPCSRVMLACSGFPGTCQYWHPGPRTNEDSSLLIIPGAQGWLKVNSWAY